MTSASPCQCGAKLVLGLCKAFPPWHPGWLSPSVQACHCPGQAHLYRPQEHEGEEGNQVLAKHHRRVLISPWTIWKLPVALLFATPTPSCLDPVEALPMRTRTTLVSFSKLELWHERVQNKVSLPQSRLVCSVYLGPHTGPSHWALTEHLVLPCPGHKGNCTLEGDRAAEATLG